jgi:eukaryotic-like serine/threonine-protein kinase
MPVAIGDVLGQKYQLEAQIGEGGMARVFRAKRLTNDTAVAIKVLHDTLRHNEEACTRFLREAKTATELRHPNVVEALDLGTAEGGQPYLVLELLTGCSLSEYAEARRRNGEGKGRLSLAELLTFLTPILEALEEAHGKGIVHRDLKPENVFLAEERGMRIPKLLDFGISRIGTDQDARRVTGAGASLGTPSYMAPEQVLSTKDADARSDIWSLGVSMYELLTGQLPFEGRNAPSVYLAIATSTPPAVHTVVPELPPGADQIIARCLRKEPSERYLSVADLARDLYLLQLDIEATRSSAF